MTGDPFAGGPEAAPPPAPPAAVALADPREQRVERWAEAWRRKADDAEADPMFRWAREHGQIKECLDGLLRSRSFHEAQSADDKALADRLGDEAFDGRRA